VRGISPSAQAGRAVVRPIFEARQNGALVKCRDRVAFGVQAARRAIPGLLFVKNGYRREWLAIGAGALRSRSHRFAVRGNYGSDSGLVLPAHL
jgi:hypothetical protein